jgi:Family of unknown function (DUF5681)
MPFEKGQSGNPNGRPKGSRNKLSEAFLQALSADFNAHGTAVIEKVRAEKAHEYLKIVALLVPKQVELDGVAQPFAVIPAELTSPEAWEKAVAPRLEPDDDREQIEALGHSKE